MNTGQNKSSARSYRPMLVLVVAFAAGVCCDWSATAAGMPSGVLMWWMAAAVWLAVWWGLGRRTHDGPAVGVRSVVLCVSILCAGAAWHHASWNHFDIREIGRYAAPHAAPTCIEAVVLQSPRSLPAIPPSPYRAIPTGERSQLQLAVSAIRRGTSWQQAGGRARLTVDGQLLGLRAGDRVRIFAQIAAPRAPKNPGEFDYAAHARADRRLADFRTGFPECVEVIERGAGLRPRRLLDRAQSWCLTQFTSQLADENGTVAAALVLGAREGIAREEMDVYRATGTIHLLVVSGLHVGILAAAAFFLFSRLFHSRRHALVATAILVVAFALLTGARPSVIRAAVCTLAVLAAVGTGRPFERLNLLATAAIVVMIINPSDLFRPGPQLSFLAAGTLIWYAGWVRRRMESESPLDQIRRDARPLPLYLLDRTARQAGHVAAVAFCLWFVSSPILMSEFHLFTPIAVIVAPVAGMLASIALTTGFALLVVQAIVPIGGVIFRDVCDVSIDIFRWIVAFAEELPWGHAWVAGPALWWTIGFYVGLVAALLLGRRVPLRWKAAAFALWMAVGFGSSLASTRATEELRCTFLSVGHGTCVVLQTPDGSCLLYDAGSLGSPELAAESIASFLWSEGITRLDGVILSHADIDHFNAMPGLLQRFSMAGVFVSPVMFEPLVHPDPSAAPRRLQDALASRNLPVRDVVSSDRLDLGGGVTATVLHPARQPVLGASDNAYSIVLAVEYTGHRVLLTGDLESPGMEDVLAELPLDVDILLAPHHGSRFSDPPGLAEWCNPDWVVISGGDQSRSAEAAQTYREAGSEVVHTSTKGALDFRISREGVTLRHWAGDAWEPLRGQK